MPADLYDVLGTSTDASAEEIKRAYRERVREYHPDVNDHPDGDQQFKLIRTANDVLSDPAERKDYDRLGHREYVEKQLDDLPPISVFPDEDLPDGATTAEPSGDDGSDSSASPTAASSGTGRSSSSGSSTAAASSGTSSSASSTTAGSASTDSSDRRSSTGSSRGSSAGSASAGTGSRSDASGGSNGGSSDAGTTAGAERDSWDAAASSTRTTTGASAGVRRRRGLKRWYGVVALSLVTYLTGLGLYGYTRLDALRGVVADLTASPVSTLLGTFPLASPTEYVLDAVRAATAGSPEIGLVLLAGTVLLPLVVLTTVGRFGRGAAWMYALPSLAPAACLGLWTAIAVPTWLALVGLVILPVLSGGGFLVDVGRYLRATR